MRVTVEYETGPDPISVAAATEFVLGLCRGADPSVVPVTISVGESYRLRFEGRTPDGVALDPHYVVEIGHRSKGDCRCPPWELTSARVEIP